MAEKDERLFGTIPMNGVPVSAKDIIMKNTKLYSGKLRGCELCGNNDLELVKDASGMWYVRHKHRHSDCLRDWDKTYPSMEEAYIRWNHFDYRLY